MAESKIPQPFKIDTFGHPKNTISRSICGTDDMTPILNASEQLQTMGTPVGIFEASDEMGNSYCSGTFISKDLFLTAGHCSATCKDIKVTFGYLEENRQESFHCSEIVEEANSSNDEDYMIIKLEGNPGVNWGWYGVSAKPVEPKSELLIIHHPKATPMKVSQKDCILVKEESNFLMHRCDTQPGTSGSAILLPNYNNPEETRIVGVHTLGGCDETDTSTNSGPSMRHLVELSPTLNAMAK